MCSSEVEVEPASEVTKKRARKAPTSPTFTLTLPGTKHAQVGEELTLKCSLSGYPTPSVSWKRDGYLLIPESTRCSITYDGETSTLKIPNLDLISGGTYVCLAKNASGETQTQTQLEVTKPPIREDDGLPPKFLSPIRKTIEASGGKEIKLVGEIIEGTEPIQCKWIHDKVEIPDSGAFKYAREGKDTVLVIKDAFPEDSGEYVCVAKNKYGGDKCHVELHIFGKF